jgi:hypothetical protein
MTNLLVTLFGASWRTTLLGFAEAIGMAVLTYLAAGIPDLSDSQKQQIFIGGLLTAVVTAIRGYFTKDKNVSNSPTPLAVAQPIVPLPAPPAQPKPIMAQPAPMVETLDPVVAHKVPSTAPIGQTVNGMKITHYGYPGDSSPDSNSMKAIGDRGNKLTPNFSAALTRSAREKLFNASHPSTGQTFVIAGFTLRDDDTAPESDERVDVYDPYYAGIDVGCSQEMYAKSKAEMVAAGILT